MFTHMPNGRVLQIVSVVNFLLLFPLMAADLTIYYNYSDTRCAKESNVTGVDLLHWLKIDGYTKLAVVAMLVFFNLAAREITNHRILVVSEGLILILYYMFLFGWLVTAAVIFWGDAYPKGHCNNEFGHYIWAALIIGFVSVPVGIFFALMRGGE